MTATRLWTTPRLLGLAALCLLLGGCCVGEPMRSKLALSLPTPTDLPERVHFRTRTESFNSRYYLALRQGRIWFKDNVEATGRVSAWHLLGRTGIPEGCGLVRFPSPRRVVAISADGVHLQALSDQGILYRATNLREDPDDPFTWTDRWGWPAGQGPGLRWPFGQPIRWDVSDSHPLELKYYEDGNGTRHHVGLGVAHLYALGPQGVRLYFNDWWLPADFSRQICGPHRGAFEAMNLSASASTLFLIGRGGAMYTMMYDFDISGENPLLTYTFVQRQTSGTLRKVPMPGWRRQPPVGDGRITSTITIFQTGQGNAARTLRVEGEQGGQSGYFHKPIFAPRWSFQPTGHRIRAPFLRGPPAPVPNGTPSGPDDRRLVGRLRRDGVEAPLEVELSNFNLVCSPAEMRILHGGVPITAGGRELVLTFHHVHTLVTEQRPMAYWQRGIAAQIRGAIVVPAALQRIDDPRGRARVLAHLGGLEVVNLKGTATERQLDMKELSVWDFFRAPMSEKGGSSRFTLALSMPRR